MSGFMDSRPAVKIAVGIFVFTALLLFAGSLFLVGQRGGYFAPQHLLRAFFTDVSGLRAGAPVRVAGVTAGRVSRIQLPTLSERRVLVELDVTADALDSLRRDSVARVGTLGFMGDKFVEISVGSARKPRLLPGATIAAEESTDFGALIGQGERVLRHAERLGASLERGEGALPWLVNDPESKRLLVEALGSVRAAGASAQRLAASLERGDGVLPWLVNDPDSKRLLAETLGSLHSSARAAERLAASFEHGGGALPWLLNDPESKQQIAQALDAIRGVATAIQHGDGAVSWLIRDPASRRFVEDLGRTAETLAALTKEVKEGRGLAHALIYDPEGGKMLKRASQAVEEVRSLLQAIESGDGAIAALLFDPESRQLVENLQKTSRHLEEITGKIARGEGTLGALLADPTVYEDLTTLLEGAERSWILRWGIRHTLKAGQKARNEKTPPGANER